MTSGPLIIGIENRQGNLNVKLEQAEELTRMLDNIEAHGLYVRMFRADCGSFIKELVEELFLRTETFYLRASSCADRRQMYEQCKDWRHTSVNGQEMDVTSFEFTEFLSDWHLRLVVQRTKMDAEQGERFLPGMEYMYRAILTSDHNSTEGQVIDKYNQRGACEKNFDVQNNDFGWAHLPFSTMEDNTVFLLFTAMLKNFYLGTCCQRSAQSSRTRNLLLRRQLLYPVELLNPEKRQPALFSECKISTINIHNQIKLYFFCRLFLWLDLISAPGMDRQETAQCLGKAHSLVTPD